MKSLISSEVEDFLSDNHLRMIVKQLDQRFLHIDIIYSSTQITRGAFAIVPGAGGLAAKSLLKHMPALGTVMKTVSKTMDDAVKPIKSKVDHLTITGKQAVKTTVAKTQQQALKATDSVKLVKQNLTLTGKQALKITHKKVSQATNSVKSAKQSMETAINKTLEHAKQLGKAHVDQMKFALTHPIIATVTSKAGQKSIRGTASIIDDVKRPFYIKSMEVIDGPKIPVGIERGPSNDVIKNMGEDLISRMQAEKDAIKGTNANGKHLDNIPRIKEIEVNFKRNVKHDSEEFARQLKDQEKGMNELTVDEYLKNRDRYIAEGRAIEGNAAQKMARQEALKDKITELRKQGLSRADATKQASEWLETKAALHNPDQIAGGKVDIIGGLGDKRVNSSIGSQWKYRIDVVDEQIKEIAKNMSPEQLKNTYLNVKLTQ